MTKTRVPDPTTNKKLKEVFGKMQERGDAEKVVEKINKRLDSVQKKAEKIRDSIIKRHKNEVLGTILYYRPHPPSPTYKKELDIPTLLIVSELKKKSNKEKIEHILKIEKEGNNLIKNNELRVSCFLLEEFWEFASRGQYDILRNLVTGRILHDKGDWIKSLKAVELHKLKMLRKFEKYVISYVISGSLIRGDANVDSDVDISIVIDDTDVLSTTANELIARLRNMSNRMAADAQREAGIKGKLNIQIWILTRFWEGLRRAEPIFYTTLRDGVALYDRGMFAPWKLMLKKGMLIPSPEAIRKYIQDGKKYMERLKFKFKTMGMDDFFWMCIYPAQGLLMLAGVPPGSPNQVAAQMREHLVKKNILDKKYVKTYEKVHQLRKDLEYGKVKDVKPQQIVNLSKSASEFVEAIEKSYNSLEKEKVSDRIKNLKNTSKEDIKLILKVAGIKVNKKNVNSTLKSELIDKGLARSRYSELLVRLTALNKEIATLAEVESIEYGLETIRAETINIINASKGLNKDKYKITLKYGAGEKQKTALFWLFTKNAFLLKDVSSPHSKMYKYDIDGTGRLSNEQKTTSKVLENKLSTFEGTQTRITAKTINKLKELLGKNLQLLIG